jgi:RHS repeat-associated protein
MQPIRLSVETNLGVGPFWSRGRALELEPNAYRSETAAPHYRARYYDPQAGRFVSEDPIGFKTDTNFYEYVFNSATMLRDPLGLFPTPWHRQVTFDLARAVFGGKCLDKARTVADADAGVDAFGYGSGGGVTGTVKGFFQFMTDQGEAWAQPGPHFPSRAMLEQLHNKAMSTCSLKALGEGLHSRQDAYAHSGWSSFDHYTHSFLSLGLAGPDADAVSNLGWQDAAMSDTVRELSQFKSKCLGCCQ